MRQRSNIGQIVCIKNLYQFKPVNIFVSIFEENNTIKGINDNI